MKHIAILGSTGSIGKQALEVIRNNREIYCVESITANSSIELFEQQIREFEPKVAVIADEVNYKKLSSDIKSRTEILVGEEGLKYASALRDVDIVISAIVGIAGLVPTYHAIKNNKTIALANKETLVAAGHLIIDEAKKNSVSILPVDSEHSAIFQSIGNNKQELISKIILTASGGPFRNKTQEELKKVTLEDALKHPNWSMGSKISIDSATMMNKGLEVIEAKWLFNLEINQIDVCIHPQSIIHSMVEYVDGAVIAQLGLPDMKIPIQYALTYPQRLQIEGKKLDLTEITALNFYKPDIDKFSCLRLAYQALEAGDSSCIVLNGANEEAVKLFMSGKINFIDISQLIEAVLNKHVQQNVYNLDEVLSIDRWAKNCINEIYEARCRNC